MKYLSSTTQIGDNLFRVDGIHHLPFDEKHGLSKSIDELNQGGFLVPDIPTMPQAELGFENVLIFNSLTQELYYEKHAKPQTEITRIEQLEQLVADLTSLVLGV